MKEELMKALGKTLMVLIGLLLVHPMLAQYNQSKTFEKTYTVSKGGLLKISHRRGELNIKKSNTSQIKIRLEVDIEGSREEDVIELLSNIELDNSERNNQITIEALSNIKNWSKINRKSYIELKSGKELRGIQEIVMDMVVEIPDGINLELSNKYDDINITNIKGNIKVKNYNGDVNTGDVDGDVNLDIKYGKANLGNIRNMEATLYEGQLSLGNASDVKINSKYTTVSMGNLKSAEIESYESDFNMGNIKGDVYVKDKYSDWSLGSFMEGKLDCYESDWNVGNIDNVNVESKHGEYNIGNAKEVAFEKSYQDDIDIGALEVFRATASKYLDANIGVLKRGLYLKDDYNGDVEIQSVTADFEGVEVIAKNTDIEIPLNNMKYTLDVDVRNGDISFEEDNLDEELFTEYRNNLTIKGKMNGGNSNSPKVVLKGSNMDVELE
ncbi:MAG: hypothetical protein AAF573_03425 [Bacteroidota bacterium]